MPSTHIQRRMVGGGNAFQNLLTSLGASIIHPMDDDTFAQTDGTLNETTGYAGNESSHGTWSNFSAVNYFSQVNNPFGTGYSNAARISGATGTALESNQSVNELQYTGGWANNASSFIWWVLASDWGGTGTVQMLRYSQTTATNINYNNTTGNLELSFQSGAAGTTALTRSVVFPTANTMYGAVETYDGAGSPTVKFYINGVLRATHTAAIGNRGGITGYTAGSTGGTWWSANNAGDVSTWGTHATFKGTALTADNLLALYNAGK